MAKRSRDEWNSEWVKGVDDVKVIKEEMLVAETVLAKDWDIPEEDEAWAHLDEPETIRLMLLKNLKLNYYGKVTKRLYVFSGGGAVVEVDKRDAEIMLEKMGGNCSTCPSAIGRTPYFAVVEV